MRDHELRRSVVGEMHLRRWPRVEVPSRIVQWVAIVAEADRKAEMAAIDSRANHQRTNPAHRGGVLSPGVRFAWERHSEGSSLTLFAEDGADLEPALAWARELPLEVLRATAIWIVADDAAAEAILPGLELIHDELVSCHLGERIRFWSDFRIKPDGFGHLAIAANGAEPGDLTRQIQRLQELGNYRNRALLGLPLAKETWPRLDRAEDRLSEFALRVADTSAEDEELMGDLTALSLDLVAIASGIGFRMDATEAYSRLVEERLVELDCRPIAGFASLGDFHQRRFLPAANTCRATTRRTRELSVRAAELSALLRGRIEARIEEQNARLLHSLERSAKTQLRLQQLVEGFSVIALSYYLLALAKLALGGAEKRWPGLDAELIVGLLVVPTLFVLWLTIRALKKRVVGGS